MLRWQRHFRMLTALAVAAYFALSSAAAEAGTYTTTFCTQNPSGHTTGWHQERTTSGSVPYFWTSLDCADPDLGAYRQFDNFTVPAGASYAWIFDAPADTWIEKADFAQSATARVAGAYDGVYADLDNNTSRTLGMAVASTSPVLSSDTYYLPVSGTSHAVRLRSEIGCQSGGANCAATSSTKPGNEYRLRGATVYLNDPSTATIESVSGGGWSTAPADGVSSIDYSGADKGAGITEVRFYVDGIPYDVDASACAAGEPVPCPLNVSGSFVLDTTRLAEGQHTLSLVAADYSGNEMALTDKALDITVRRAPAISPTSPVSTTNPSWNGGGSPAVGDQLQGSTGGWSGDDLTFTYQWLRCDSDGTNCVPIDGATGLSYTPRLDDVGHTLQFCVTGTNSGGSATSCAAPTPVVIAAHPSTSGDGAASPADAGSPSTATPAPTGSGSGIASGSRGAANGSPATDRAVLTVFSSSRARTKKVKFGKRVRLDGRLVGPDGAPIAGAVLTVQTQTSMPGAAMADAARVVTGSDGRFSYVAPAGPSRTVRFGYRSFSADNAFADTSDVQLLVSAGVTMKAKPRKVRNRHATVFTGRLLGRPIPRRGVVVDLQVFFRKHWRTFAAPRTNRRGVYRFKYRFMAGAATWKFRARVRADGRYPYAQGFTKRQVKVRVLP
jgi:hypothetical protein